MISGGFTLDGTNAAELGMYMSNSSQFQILPGTVDRTLTIPGLNGAWDFGADLGPKPINIGCALYKRSAIDLLQAASVLAGFLLDQYGKPRNMTLVFDYLPDRAYTVRYSGSLPLDRLVGLGQFTLPLIAFDPHAYANPGSQDKDLEYDVGLDYDAGLIYPNPTGFNWLYPEQHSSLYNYSTLVTPITLAIEGTAVGISIEHEQSGNILVLPDIDDQLMVINTKKQTVKIGNDNALSGTSGNWFQLLPGDNGFVFRCSSANADVVYDWKIKYA